MKKFVTSIAAALLAAGSFATWAAGNHGAHGTKEVQAQAPAAAAADMTDGEVRKVDAEGAKVTLKHGDIKALDMPAMTMVFNVKDKAMLANVKSGDKVKFKAVNDAGKFTITEMQVVR